MVWLCLLFLYVYLDIIITYMSFVSIGQVKQYVRHTEEQCCSTYLWHFNFNYGCLSISSNFPRLHIFSIGTLQTNKQKLMYLICISYYIRKKAWIQNLLQTAVRWKMRKNVNWLWYLHLLRLQSFPAQLLYGAHLPYFCESQSLFQLWSTPLNTC